MIRHRIPSPRRRSGGRPRLLLAVAALVAAVVLAGCSTTTASSSAATPAVEVSPSALALQQQFVQVVKQVSPSVVLIRASQGLGSGIVFDANRCQTLAHNQGERAQLVGFGGCPDPEDARLSRVRERPEYAP